MVYSVKMTVSEARDKGLFKTDKKEKHLCHICGKPTPYMIKFTKYAVCSDECKSIIEEFSK